MLEETTKRLTEELDGEQRARMSHKEGSSLTLFNEGTTGHTDISQELALTAREEAAKLIDFELLGKSIKEIGLEELSDVYPKMLKGETSGRYIVNLNK